MQTSDKELIRGLQEGNEAAFREFFDRYRDFVYSFACRMLESDIAAKDTVQDVFIKLWQHRHSLHEINNITGYIQRLTRNHILNGIKRKANEESILHSLQSVLPTQNNNTEEVILKKDLDNLLMVAISQLPAQQQKVYILSRTEGLKHEEIAERLQISKETVKKHMMAAIKSVQQYILNSNSALGMLALCLLEIYL